jgi:hypothetical protein
MKAFKELPKHVQDNLILLECKMLLRQASSEKANDWEGIENICMLYEFYTYYAQDPTERNRTLSRLVQALMKEATYRCEQMSLPDRAYIPDGFVEGALII